MFQSAASLLLNLPKELQLSILEYIVTREDLKSLCLTSKALRFHAIPRLYERIDIRLWSRADTARFIQCNLNGAGKHLRHTRELVVEDHVINEEPATIHWRRIDLPRIYGEEDNQVPPNERDNYLYQILQMLPDQVLYRFCFISERFLSPLIHEHLRSYQSTIRELQISLYTEPGEPGQLPQVFYGLQSLHLYINEPAHMDIFLRNIWCVCKSLRQLSLCAPDYRGEFAQQAQNTMSTLEFDRYTPNLKQLKLIGLDITDLFQPFAQFVNFHSLTHLGIWGCRGVEKFISDLSISAQNHELSLESIAAGTFIHSGHEWQHFNKCFEHVLAACPLIKSLHAGFHDRLCLPLAVLVKIAISGRDLRMLSLYSEWDDMWLDEGKFDGICKACPNLQQLACQIDEIALLAPPGYENYETFVESIRRLKELRLLHLQVKSKEHLGFLPGASTERNMEYLSIQMQKAANKIFYDVHQGQASKLDALVFGCMTPLVTDRDLQQVIIPQFCFMKGQQTDSLNRTVTVGVPVTRAMLRRTHPYTDVLDLEPEGAVWTQWASRAI